MEGKLEVESGDMEKEPFHFIFIYINYNFL